MIRNSLLIALLLFPPAAQADPAPRPVLSEIVTADQARQRAFPGVIAAEVTAELAFQTLGRIATLDVNVGDVVAKGDVLATLDQVTLTEDVEAAKAALTGAKAQADLAEQTLARTKQLVQRNVATQAQLEAAQGSRDAAAAAVISAEAVLTRANDAERFGTLAAPMDGIVLATNAKPGTVVSAGMVVVTLAGQTGREAVIDVPSEFLALLPEGAKFTVRGRTPAMPPLEGSVRLVEPVADAGTRSRRLRLRLGDVPAIYRLGSLVTATLSAEAPEILSLPRSAIAGTPDAPTVWKVSGEPRQVHAIPVTLGPALEVRVVIKSGLAEGDEIVVRGVHSLTEGETVGERIE